MSRLIEWEPLFEDAPIELFEFPDTGRGMRAKRRIEIGDVIVCVPHARLVRPRDFSALVSSDTSDEDEELLAAWLIRERRVIASRWRPYLDSLPVEYDNAAYFTKDELLQLPPRAYREAVVFRRRFAARFNVVQRLLQGDVTPAEFRWAMCTVNTRCVHDGVSGPLLAPYLDLLNHSSAVSVERRLCAETGNLELVAGSAFEQGEQVFISYGPHDNTTLLIEYGFICCGNVNDTVELAGALCALLDENSTLAQDPERLEACRTYARSSPVGVHTDTHEWTWSMMLCCRLATAERCAVDRLFTGAVLSPQSEQRARALLVRVCERALEDYMAPHCSEKISYRACTASALYATEKRVLQYVVSNA